jgi:hypothetical protein
LQKLCAPLYDRQRVIEIVSNARREFADSAQLIRLRHLFARALALRPVAQEDERARDRAIFPERRSVCFDKPHGFVRADRLNLVLRVAP